MLGQYSGHQSLVALILGQTGGHIAGGILDRTSLPLVQHRPFLAIARRLGASGPTRPSCTSTLPRPSPLRTSNTAATANVPLASFLAQLVQQSPTALHGLIDQSVLRSQLWSAFDISYIPRQEVLEDSATSLSWADRIQHSKDGHALSGRDLAGATPYCWLHEP